MLPLKRFHLTEVLGVASKIFNTSTLPILQLLLDSDVVCSDAAMMNMSAELKRPPIATALCVYFLVTRGARSGP